MFPQTGTLPGDHFSIVRPTKTDDLVVRALCDACHRSTALEPDAMVLTTQILDPRKRADVEAAETLLGENFLSSQNVSADDFRFWLAHYEETFGLPLRVIVARRDDRIDGLLMFHESAAESLIVIDYIACRQSPVQSLLFRKLLDQLRARATSVGIRSVVFEMEDPATADDPTRARARLRKFEALGARIIGNLGYLAPDMDEFGAFGEESPYLLMHIFNGLGSPTLSRARVQKIVRFLYTVWYSNWFSRRFVERETDLKTYVEALYARVAGGTGTLPDKCPLQKSTP